MKTEGTAFFKTGAWILLLAGFAHAAVAFFDIFLSGAFSPASDGALTVLKDTSLNISDWLGGSNTAVFESAWGAYIGFAIAVGLLTGFIGLFLLLALNSRDFKDACNRRLLYTALVMSVVMTLIAALFYFWFPLTVYAAVLICFIIAWFKQGKGDSHAAR
jgi:Ca2+/Na+ antiporter